MTYQITNYRPLVPLYAQTPSLYTKPAPIQAASQTLEQQLDDVLQLPKVQVLYIFPVALRAYHGAKQVTQNTSEQPENSVNYNSLTDILQNTDHFKSKKYPTEQVQETDLKRPGILGLYDGFKTYISSKVKGKKNKDYVKTHEAAHQLRDRYSIAMGDRNYHTQDELHVDLETVANRGYTMIPERHGRLGEELLRSAAWNEPTYNPDKAQRIAQYIDRKKQLNPAYVPINKRSSTKQGGSYAKAA